MAHTIVPLLSVVQEVTRIGGFYTISKCMGIFSIMWYQLTILLAQLHEMKNQGDFVFRGYDLWFTIEIVSFYGYILSGSIFIFENQVLSMLGWLNKTAIKDQIEYDFLTYHTKDLDWFAFIIILSGVNITIMYMNSFTHIQGMKIDNDGNSVQMTETDLNGPLLHTMYLLLSMHILQLVFLRRFFDENGRVNVSNQWVWYVHFIIYPYVIYSFYVDCIKPPEYQEKLESRRVWIPMDLILTICIGIYFIINLYAHENLLELQQEEEVVEEDDQCNID